MVAAGKGKQTATMKQARTRDFARKASEEVADLSGGLNYKIVARSRN
jgi:hypothetical protein